MNWNDATDLGGGWKWYNWFGTFNDTASGWIWHKVHGWLYPVGTYVSNFWLWNASIGWLWTNSTTYPWVWCVTLNRWLWYEDVTVVFDHAESRSNWGACALMNTKFGLFHSVLNEDSRRNSELYLNGVLIYEGDQESIGQGVETDDAVYFPAEGNGVIFWNGSADTSFYQRHSSASIMYRNQPCVIASLDEGEHVMNAQTGAKLLKLNCPAKVGIPFAVAKIPGSDELIIVLADNDGAERLITTTGISILMRGATSVVNWNGRLLAGAEGKIYDVDLDSRMLSYAWDTGSHLITHMWYDADTNWLWVCTSGPDRLIYISNEEGTHYLIELDDGNPNGQMFGSRVTNGWWSRDKVHQGQWYRVIR